MDLFDPQNYSFEVGAPQKLKWRHATCNNVHVKALLPTILKKSERIAVSKEKVRLLKIF